MPTLCTFQTTPFRQESSPKRSLESLLTEIFNATFVSLPKGETLSDVDLEARYNRIIIILGDPLLSEQIHISQASLISMKPEQLEVSGYTCFRDYVQERACVFFRGQCRIDLSQKIAQANTSNHRMIHLV